MVNFPKNVNMKLKKNKYMSKIITLTGLSRAIDNLKNSFNNTIATSTATDREIDRMLSETLDNIDVLTETDINEIINQQF